MTDSALGRTRQSVDLGDRPSAPMNIVGAEAGSASNTSLPMSTSLPSPSQVHSASSVRGGSVQPSSPQRNTMGTSLKPAHKDSFGRLNDLDTSLSGGNQVTTQNPPPFRVSGGQSDRFASLEQDDRNGDLTNLDSTSQADSSLLHYDNSSPTTSRLTVSTMRPERSSSLANISTPTRTLASGGRALSPLVAPGTTSDTMAGSSVPAHLVKPARSPMSQTHPLSSTFVESSPMSISNEQAARATSDAQSSQPSGLAKNATSALKSDAVAKRDSLRQQAQRTQTNGSTEQQQGGTRTAYGNTRQVRLPGTRVVPQLPSAKDVKPAPPPAMYWSRVPVHGSVPRRSFRAHSACLADEVLWLFGGCDSKGCFHDLYCFDTETMCWSKPKVTGDVPPARRAHSATMVDRRLYVFAGGDGPYYFNDLYIFDTIALRWTKPEVYGQAPSPRRAHTSSYHDGQLIIFGGGNGVGALNDVYSLDITDLTRLEWRKIECGGVVPIGRGYHTSNLVDGKLIVIGGSDGHMSFDDIHILKLDTKTWYRIKTDEVHNRLGHTATQVGSYLFVVGGHDSHRYTPDILTLNLVNLQWEPRAVCGVKPPGRGYHQSWLRDGRLFVHGGFDGKEIYDDLYYVDLSACAYLPQITSFSVELEDD